jgi:Aminotransferase class I and II
LCRISAAWFSRERTRTNRIEGRVTASQIGVGFGSVESLLGIKLLRRGSWEVDMRYASITDRLPDLGSEKWKIHLRGRETRARGKPVIELTIGEPAVDPDPQLLDVCECGPGARATPTAAASHRSLPHWRRSTRAEPAREITEQNVLSFPGTQTALFPAMLGLVEKGDKVLVPDPYYATYEALAHGLGAELVPVPLEPTNGFHLRPEVIEAAIAPRCRFLLLNSPHNPSGAVLSRAEIAAIGELRRKHDLWITNDGVYEDLTFAAAFASPLDIEFAAGGRGYGGSDPGVAGDRRRREAPDSVRDASQLGHQRPVLDAAAARRRP